MDIINIITTENNIVSDIKSYAIVNPEEQGVVSEQVEKDFAEMVKDLSGEKMDDESLEAYTEDGYYETNGIAISIIWSYSTNE